MPSSPPTSVQSPRVLIVSNRLPVTARRRRRTTCALAGAPAAGWPPACGRWHEAVGRAVDRLARRRVALHRRSSRPSPIAGSRPRASCRCTCRASTSSATTRGFSNRVLWPLFHYLIDRVPVDADGWDAYVAGQRARSPTRSAREYRPGDTIWVHDYQLMLLPALLRERLPDARIGFFLHIPFPSSEVFRMLPWRREILHGLLGADLVGFHTFAYLRHFVASLLHVDGVEADDRPGARRRPRGRSSACSRWASTRREFAALARDPAVIAEDRGDPPRRRRPPDRARRRSARLHQGHPAAARGDRAAADARSPSCASASATSRSRCRRAERSTPTSRFKRQVEEGVGRINGACGTLRSTPVHYVHRSVSRAAAGRALLRRRRDAGDAAARRHEPGRQGVRRVARRRRRRAGAQRVRRRRRPSSTARSSSIPTTSTAWPTAMRQRAGDARSASARARMKALRRRVSSSTTCTPGRAASCSALARRAARRRGAAADAPEPRLCDAHWREVRRTTRIRAAARLRRHAGAVRAFAGTGGAGRRGCWRCCASSAATPGIAVDIVSGRPARHARGVVRRPAGRALGGARLLAPAGAAARSGSAAATAPADWMARILPILEQFTDSTPGSQIEVKSASIAWHYRGAQREFGARQAHELRMLLGDALSNQPLEVLEGKKVIEVRLRGVSKAVVARSRAPAARRRHLHRRHRRRPHRRRPVSRAAAVEHHRRGRAHGEPRALPRRRLSRRARVAAPADCTGRGPVPIGGGNRQRVSGTGGVSAPRKG